MNDNILEINASKYRDTTEITEKTDNVLLKGRLQKEVHLKKGGV